jgi:NAD dependent epimerase/dehydratase family
MLADARFPTAFSPRSSPAPAFRLDTGTIMDQKVFLAGATGAIGRRLVPLLLQGGYEVFGTTRSAAKASDLSAASVEPLVLDVFDLNALMDAVMRVRPTWVIHQLTDLPPGLDPSRMAEAAPGMRGYGAKAPQISWRPLEPPA